MFQVAQLVYFSFLSSQHETERHSKPHNYNKQKIVFRVPSAHSAQTVQPTRMQNLTGTFLGNNFFCYPIQDKRIGYQNLLLVESFLWFRFY